MPYYEGGIFHCDCGNIIEMDRPKPGERILCLGCGKTWEVKKKESTNADKNAEVR